ncbi:MAG: peptide chain release factor N(5)-glutamine methyltransferase [Rikenellaceae bacterium]
MKIRDILERLHQAAAPLYGVREAHQISRIAAMEVWGFTPTDLILKIDEEHEGELKELEHIASEIASGRPLQYILGESEFCGLTLSLKEGVLIPRPETEELVNLIVEEYARTTPKILDIGTGSGAIAISLAHHIKGSRLFALDLSQDALGIAKANAERNALPITFIEGDALLGVENATEEREFDVVVSNPPYIPRSESSLMRPNVLDFEPHLALFVEDDNPLIFYRSIARSSLVMLKSGGRLYFECHEDYVFHVEQLLRDKGYHEVQSAKDINNKPRMVWATRP